MMQEGSCRDSICAARVDQSVCKSASQDSKHSIASAQIICKQTTFTEHGQASLHCQPFAILQFVAKHLIRIRSSQPARIGPFAKKNQKRIHAFSKATKSKKATSVLDR
jgi:hypothetical protein